MQYETTEPFEQVAPTRIKRRTRKKEEGEQQQQQQQQDELLSISYQYRSVSDKKTAGRLVGIFMVFNLLSTPVSS